MLIKSVENTENDREKKEEKNRKKEETGWIYVYLVLNCIP